MVLEEDLLVEEERVGGGREFSFSLLECFCFWRVRIVFYSHVMRV